jgi:hypothetical protein
MEPIHNTPKTTSNGSHRRLKPTSRRVTAPTRWPERAKPGGEQMQQSCLPTDKICRGYDEGGD